MNETSQPLRVLHVIDSLAPGGAESMLVELVNGMFRSHTIPAVCVTRNDVTLAKKLHKEITLCQLNRKWKGDLKPLQFYRRFLESEHIQIIHVHGYSSFMFAFFARFITNIHLPIILHAHSSLPPNIITSLCGWFGVDYFIGVSQEPVHWAQHRMRLSKPKIGLLSNGIDPRTFEVARPMELSSFFETRPEYIGVMTANVLPAKNFEFLFQSLALSQFRDQMGILIIGSTAHSAYFDNCCILLKQLGLQDRVAFLGKREDVPAILAACDFGLFSSSRETGPVAVLEYMASGVPFVSTCVGDINHQAAAAGMPGIVPAGDKMAFVAAIDDLLSLSTSERIQRIQKGKELIRSQFDIRNRIVKLENIYQNLVHVETL